MKTVLVGAVYPTHAVIPKGFCPVFSVNAVRYMVQGHRGWDDSSGNTGVLMGERHERVSPGGLDPSRWVALHGEAMFSYARLRLSSAESAEEAVQEAMLAALRSRCSFDGRSTERTWLIGVLRHKVLDALRAGRRAPAELDKDDSAYFRHGYFTEPQRVWPVDLGDDEVREALLGALDGLPEVMRRALVLREIDGLAGKTVCEILGVTPTNLWTLVHRGKARLRKMLTERFESGEDHR